MKNLKLSILFILLSINTMVAQVIQQSTGTGTTITAASISITSPVAANRVYQGSLTRCTWSHTNDLAFGTRVSVMLLTKAQRTDLVAKMQRFGNNILPVDSIQNTLGIASADVNSGCDWNVSATQATGDYAIVVRHQTGKLGVGPVFRVSPSALQAPNILNYSPKEKGSVFGGTITFTGRGILPEAVQVFIGTEKLKIISASSGQVVAAISGTSAGPLKIGLGLPVNTVTLEANFRPVGVPEITDVQPRGVLVGTEVTVTGKNLDYVSLRKNSFQVHQISSGIRALGKDPATFLSLPHEDQWIKKLLDLKNQAAMINECNKGYDTLLDGTVREYFKQHIIAGPKLINIDTGTFRISQNGTKITFKVAGLFKTLFALCNQGKVMPQGMGVYDYIDPIGGGAPSNDLISLKDSELRFSSSAGDGIVISPYITLRQGSIASTAGSGVVQPAPSSRLSILKVNSGGELNASNNAVRIFLPVQGINNGSGHIDIIGKGLHNAVVKLGGTVMVSGSQTFANENGTFGFSDKDGNEVLSAVIPTSTESGILEVSKGGVSIKFPTKIIIVPEPRVTSASPGPAIPVNTDITLTGFDFKVPPEARGITYEWAITKQFPQGFTFRQVSSTTNSFTFRIEMAPGTPTMRNIQGIGNNVSVFGNGEGALQFQLQLRHVEGNSSFISYDLYLTQ